MRRFRAWLAERNRRAFAKRYPQAAWANSFATVEELTAAWERGERPPGWGEK